MSWRRTRSFNPPTMRWTSRLISYPHSGGGPVVGAENEFQVYQRGDLIRALEGIDLRATARHHVSFFVGGDGYELFRTYVKMGLRSPVVKNGKVTYSSHGMII